MTMGDSDFDDILNTLGHGRWNLLYYLGFGTINFMFPGFFLAGTFITPKVNFTCNINEEEEDIIEQDECGYTVWGNSSSEEEFEVDKKCSNWTYTDDTFPDTVTSDFHLVCDDEYMRPSYQTIMLIGAMFGSPLNGYLADRFGRRHLLFYTVTISVLSTVFQTIAHSFMILLILRFFTGCTTAATFHTGFSLCMEVCQPSHRSLVGVLTALPWAFGAMWWGLLGYLIKDWKWLMRADAAPAVLIFIWLCVIDESPRWLIVRNQPSRALKILHKASKWNGASLPPDEDLLKQMAKIEKSSKFELTSVESLHAGHVSVLGRIKLGFEQIIVLIRTPELRKRVLLLSVVIIVCSAVYYGLSFSADNLKLNPFIYMIVGGLSEVPAYSLPVPVIAKFGRVKPMAASFFICGASLGVLGFIPDPKWLVIALAMIGKFFIAATFQVIFLMISELIPTEVRIQSMGTLSLMSSFGGIAAPFVTDLLGIENPWLPSIIFGVLSVLAGIAVCFIPETLNKHLPETVYLLEQDAKRRKTRHLPEEMETFDVTVKPPST